MTVLPIGRRLARLRDVRDITQEQLAERAEVSVDTIRRLEQGAERGARMSTYQKLASALDIELARLLGQPTMTQSLAPDGGVLALRAAIQTPDGLPGLEEAGAGSEPPTAADLRPLLDQAQQQYQRGRFTDLVTTLPGLITELRAATRAAEGGPDHDVVWSMSAAAHILAADVAPQLGQGDLAYTAVERALHATVRASDALRHALAVSSLSLVLLRQGRWEQAHQVALRKAAELEPRFSTQNSEEIAVYGILLLSGAVAASRAKRADEADALIRQATAAAALSGPVRIRGILFNAARVGMQATTVQVSLGRPEAALTTADGMDVNQLQWQISRARHLLDVAYSRYQTRDDEGARNMLLELDAQHPEWLTHQMLAASTVGGLLENERRRDRDLRRLAGRLGVDPAL
jgi:transcriptional regulator with XRE-family HTH domain